MISKLSRWIGIAIVVFSALWLSVWKLAEAGMNEGAYSAIALKGLPFAEAELCLTWTEWKKGGEGIVRSFPVPSAAPPECKIMNYRFGRMETALFVIGFYQMKGLLPNGTTITAPAMGHGDGIKVKWRVPITLLAIGISFVVLGVVSKRKQMQTALASAPK